MRHCFFYSLLLVCFIASLSLAAEKKEADQLFQEQILNPQAVDAEFRGKILFARKLIAERNYQGAASFIEVLYEKNQNNQIVINLLRQCYSQLKQNFKLEELIKKQIESNPSNIGFYLSLAEVVAQQGRIDEARKHYEKAVSLIDGTNRVRYQLVIQSMLKNSLESEAEKFIFKWRKESSDNTLLGEQLGKIYERKKEYKKALDEYYPLLADTSRLGNNVEREIVELLLFEDSKPLTEAYLVEKNKKEINIRAVKILSMHYIRTGQLDKSFSYTKLRDSLHEKNGNALISYMQTRQREKLYDETIRMGDYLLSQYQQPAIQNRAKFLIADAQTHLKQYKKSQQTYSEIFGLAKSSREKADALYHIAKIYQDNLNEIDSALYYFDSLTTYYKTGINYMNAMVDVPYCYIQKGELQRAKEIFFSFEKQRFNVDIKEKILFQLAQVLFFENNIDSCKTLLSKLLINFPTGFYVNDALSLLKILQSGEDDANILKLYSMAMLFEIQKNNDSTLATYNKIIDDESKVLADFAMYKIIGIYVEQTDFVHAIETIDKMGAMFGESYYYPFALKQKADILMRETKKADEAYTIYRQLLLNFPNYPFISEVRELLRAVPNKNSETTS